MNLGGNTIYKISETELRQLACKLGKKHDVYAPVNIHDTAVFSKYRFKKIVDGDKIELHYPITPLPPTKYLFPARENILEFSKVTEKQNNRKTEQLTNKRIIFGLNIFDLLGINLLDKEFLTPAVDEKYKESRGKTLIFSIDTMDPPKEAEFDIHFKKITPFAVPAFPLVIPAKAGIQTSGVRPTEEARETSNDEYEVTAGSAEGKKIISQNRTLFKKKERRSKKEYHPKTSPIYHPEISEIIAKSKDDHVWDKLAEICLGCGICTYVCPVCYCFEVEDKVRIEGLSKCIGCRERRWDSCLLPDFAAISSHDFRPELRNRIYNWYHHKFVRTPKEYGQVGCVDCDRCIVYCPARINFHETLQYLIKKYS